MAEYKFVREARTPYSECYTIEDDTHALGRVDLHFTSSVAYGTLVVHEAIADEEIEDLIGQIDEDLVMTADPYREDLVMTVWRGEEVGVFADDSVDDADDADDDDFEDDDEAGEPNGRG
ncbi:MAG: hypothetical protein EXR66_03845 [Dehalococcoidia bacterium]|nr:hypothetical protein [Dehalococcoidia bacterium]